MRAPAERIVYGPVKTAYSPAELKVEVNLARRTRAGRTKYQRVILELPDSIVERLVEHSARHRQDRVNAAQSAVHRLVTAARIG